MKEKIVSVDFDSTLSRRDVQEYVKKLISSGVDVWVVTSRYDDLHIHRYSFEATNSDLWFVVDSLNIPRWKVRFTCGESKSLYLAHSNVIWHLDDDPVELFEIKNMKIKTYGIQVEAGSWKQKCNRLLNKKNK